MADMLLVPRHGRRFRGSGRSAARTLGLAIGPAAYALAPAPGAFCEHESSNLCALHDEQERERGCSNRRLFLSNVVAIAGPAAQVGPRRGLCFVPPVGRCCRTG